MRTRHQWIIVIAAAVLPLAGCNKGDATTRTAPPKPAAAAPLEPGGVKRITLRDIETKRLAITLAEIAMKGERLTMPYSALLYDTTGGEWAFANPETNVYLRTALKVEAIEGDTVFLAKGPAVGTRVVTAGAAELYGIEFGVGK